MPDHERRFRELFDSQFRPLLGYALRRVGSPDDAADVVAESMLVAWRRIDEVPVDDSARLWLYGVARRVVANHRRGELRRDRLAGRLRQHLVEAMPNHSELTGSTAVIQQGLDSLSDDDRELLMLTGFRSLIGKLKSVDTDTWLDAMPDTIVKQSDAPRVVDEMLADVRVPSGFDRTPFLRILVLGRYQFASKVTGAVACGWLDQWYAAKKAGDTAKVKEATTALAGSRQWKILQEVDRQGGWADAVWDAGDTLARNEDPQTVSNGLGCKVR